MDPEGKWSALSEPMLSGYASGGFIEAQANKFGPDGCLCGKCLKRILGGRDYDLPQAAIYLAKAWAKRAQIGGAPAATDILRKATRGYPVMVQVSADNTTLVLHDRIGNRRWTTTLTLGVDNQERVQQMRKRVPGMATQVPCPSCAQDLRLDVMALVIHLNDVHEWSREKIADHLDTLEASGVDLTVHSEPPAPVQVPVATFSNCKAETVALGEEKELTTWQGFTINDAVYDESALLGTGTDPDPFILNFTYQSTGPAWSEMKKLLYGTHTEEKEA